MMNMFTQSIEAIKLARTLDKNLRQRLYLIRDSVREKDALYIEELVQTETLQKYLLKHSVKAAMSGIDTKIGFSKEMHNQDVYLHLCIMSQTMLPWEDLIRLRACFFLDTEEVFHMLPTAAAARTGKFALHLWHQIPREGALSPQSVFTIQASLKAEPELELEAEQASEELLQIAQDDQNSSRHQLELVPSE
jgi:hypothetical protein